MSSIQIVFLGLYEKISCVELLQYSEGVVGSGEDVVYLASPGRPTDIGFQLGKACYPCSR